MSSCFYKIAAQRRPVSYLLMLAVLSLTLFPFHFHLHHAQDVADDGDHAHGHVHTVDLHGFTDIDAADHHDESHAIDPTTYAAVKMTGLQLPLFFAAFMLLVLLLPRMQKQRHRLVPETHGCCRDVHYTLPPLRAPPHA